MRTGLGGFPPIDKQPAICDLKVSNNTYLHPNFGSLPCPIIVLFLLFWQCFPPNPGLVCRQFCCSSRPLVGPLHLSECLSSHSSDSGIPLSPSSAAPRTPSSFCAVHLQHKYISTSLVLRFFSAQSISSSLPSYCLFH